jgi:hypothetical protein
MSGWRTRGKYVSGTLLAAALLGLLSSAAYATGTITITKAVMVEKDAPNAEVTFGYADADLSVDFRGEADCNCCDPNLTFTWNFGDGTSANGASVSHVYGTAGAGDHAPWLSVTCTCGASNISGELFVAAIDDIRVDRIGDIENPTDNGRLCFNTELRVAGTALPVGVSGSDKIDWSAQVGLQDHIDQPNTADGNLPSLADADWPTWNGAWGADTLYISIDGPHVAGQENELKLTGAVSFITNPKSIKKFYNATSSENPTDPCNWFYYYKSNAGGGAYGYTATGRSSSQSAGGIGSILIGNEAYAGDQYITFDYGNPGGRLRATGASATNRYYANFLGVLAHETQHATNQTNAGPPTDRDNDRLANDFEVNTSKTDPNSANSAQGVLQGSWPDREVYAGGPVEKDGIDNADTSNDWAHPGTNWNP